MMAALAQHAVQAPAQAAITPMAPAATALGALRITGTLARAAEARITTGPAPRALLVVELFTALGLPYAATQDLGTGFAAHLAAASKARRLHAGMRCTVTCKGLALRTDHATAALLCLGVTAVTEHQAIESRNHAD